jgi:RNA polymerase sigma factor (sigma-70 family)
MAHGQLGSLMRHMRRILRAPVQDAPDALLLERFSRDRDEAAFTALVQRHGGLVLGVCQRVLPNGDDADDAFQATFLVLAKRAGAIRKPEALSSWLHGVAARVALRARAEANRRRAHERQVSAMSPHSECEPAFDEPDDRQPGPLDAATRRELRAVLDEELSRLPEKYRMPMVLCYLEGKSNEEAAAQLRWTKGTVSGRLARARDLLRGRLARRGVVLSAGALAPMLTQNAVSAATVPAALIDTTVRHAVLFSAGKAAAFAGSSHAVALAQGTLKTLFLAKVKVAALLFLTFGIAGSAAGLAAYHASGNT